MLSALNIPSRTALSVSRFAGAFSQMKHVPKMPRFPSIDGLWIPDKRQINRKARPLTEPREAVTTILFSNGFMQKNETLLPQMMLFRWHRAEPYAGSTRSGPRMPCRPQDTPASPVRLVRATLC